MRKETEPSGFCLLGAKRLRRSVRWEKDPPDLFLFPPHPIFRMIVLPGVLFFHAEGDRTQWVLSPRREAPASVGSVGKRSTGSFSFSTSPHLPHDSFAWGAVFSCGRRQNPVGSVSSARSACVGRFDGKRSNEIFRFLQKT